MKIKLRGLDYLSIAKSCGVHQQTVDVARHEQVPPHPPSEVKLTWDLKPHKTDTHTHTHTHTDTQRHTETHRDTHRHTALYTSGDFLNWFRKSLH